MGMYLNPGNESFKKDLNNDIYVDKTALISNMNYRLDKNSSMYVCVSRPRRFGKTMAANMLVAYYSQGCKSAKLFDNLKISNTKDYVKHLNKHNVIYLNIQQFISDVTDLNLVIKCIESEVIRELREEYGDYFIENELGLPNVLAQIYQKDDRAVKGFIFIIDEWDCLFREAKNNKEIQKKYLDFLKLLLKDRSYVSLAYMTGILPIKKYGTHSAINIFREFSMMNPVELSEFVGFTEDEVIQLCRQYNMDFTQIRKWYDGYQFENQISIYNPKSVVDAMMTGDIDSYWTETETYEALKVYIEMNYDGLKEAIITMIGGGHCKINARTFQNDMTSFKSRDDVLTLLVHLGYLAYNKAKKEVYIPNQEIVSEFLNVLDEPVWNGVMQAIMQSKKFLEATLQMQAEIVAMKMDEIHMQTTSLLEFNDENSLACSVFIAYYSAKDYYMPPIRELPTGKGFADIVYLPRKLENKPALLIELKWDKTAKTAIKQIKEKGYVQALEEYAGEILLVGINYDKKLKTHECIIECYKK